MTEKYQSVEAEQGIIGSVIVDYVVIEEQEIKPEYFYNEGNRKILEEILLCYKKFGKLDLITLKDNLDEKTLFKVGGFGYIVDIIDAIDNSYFIEQYLEIVKTNYKKRQLNKLEVNDLDNFFLEVEKIEKNDVNIPIKKLEETVVEASEFIFEKDKLKENLLKTNYEGLDKAIKFFKGDITVISGQTSTGKTAFALNLLTKMSISNSGGKYSSIYFNLEMRNELIISRIVSSITSIELNKFLGEYEFYGEEKAKIQFALDKIYESQIVFVDNLGINLSVIKKTIRKIKIEKGLDFVIIDLIDKIKLPGKKKNYQELKDVMVELSKIAVDLNIHIFCLAQLNRSAKIENITSENIAGSSAIEQTASNVILFKRNRIENDFSESSIRDVDLVIDKSRNGQTTKLDYYFELEFARIKEKE